MPSIINVRNLANPKQVFAKLPYSHCPSIERDHATVFRTLEKSQGGIIQHLILLHNQLDLLVFLATLSLLCDGRQVFPRCLQTGLALIA